MNSKLPAIDLTKPFSLAQLPNGGWMLQQDRLSPGWGNHPAPAMPSPMAPATGSNNLVPTILGAYSTAEDLLSVLADVLNPPEPISELLTELPPFDPTNHPDDWMPMQFAPRNGMYVRIEDEDGARHRPMRFTAPYWWDAPNGELRLGDVTCDAGILKAAKWRPLSVDEDKRYNGPKPATARPDKLPAAFR